MLKDLFRFLFKGDSKPTDEKKEVSEQAITSYNGTETKFLGEGSFRIGGYLLENPFVYIVGRVSVDDRNSLLPLCNNERLWLQAWMTGTDGQPSSFRREAEDESDARQISYFYYTINLANVDSNLASESVKPVAGYPPYLAFATESYVKYFLIWLARQDGLHITLDVFTRGPYLTGLFHRIFIDKKDVLSILRIFAWLLKTDQELSGYFDYPDFQRAKWFLGALCVAKETSVSFSNEDMNLLREAVANGFEGIGAFMYKPGWKWDPVGLLIGLQMETLLNDRLVARCACGQEAVASEETITGDMEDRLAKHFNPNGLTFKIQKNNFRKPYILKITRSDMNVEIPYTSNWSLNAEDVQSILEDCLIKSPVRLDPVMRSKLEYFILEEPTKPNKNRHAKILLESDKNKYKSITRRQVADKVQCSTSTVKKLWAIYDDGGVSGVVQSYPELRRKFGLNRG